MDRLGKFYIVLFDIILINVVKTTWNVFTLFSNDIFKLDCMAITANYSPTISHSLSGIVVVMWVYTIAS